MSGSTSPQSDEGLDPGRASFFLGGEKFGPEFQGKPVNSPKVKFPMPN
jgi:hypothetical protein